jgi:hypothetical protein
MPLQAPDVLAREGLDLEVRRVLHKLHIVQSKNRLPSGVVLLCDGNRAFDARWRAPEHSSDRVKRVLHVHGRCMQLFDVHKQIFAETLHRIQCDCTLLLRDRDRDDVRNGCGCSLSLGSERTLLNRSSSGIDLRAGQRKFCKHPINLATRRLEDGNVAVELLAHLCDGAARRLDFLDTSLVSRDLRSVRLTTLIDLCL